MTRKQIRHSPDFLKTAMGLPQRRLRVEARTLNLGVRCCFSFNAFLAIVLDALLLPEREPEGDKEGTAFVVAARSGTGRDIHAARGVHAVVVDFGEDQLLGDPEGVV